MRLPDALPELEAGPALTIDGETLLATERRCEGCDRFRSVLRYDRPHKGACRACRSAQAKTRYRQLHPIVSHGRGRPGRMYA